MQRRAKTAQPRVIFMEKPTKRLEIVIPTYNEKDNLANTVSGLLGICDRLDVDLSVIVVDDGSTDGTKDVCKRLATNHACVRCLHHNHNEGYGSAIIDGFAAATGDYVGILDADGQFDPNDIVRLCEFIAFHDAAVGVRRKRADSLPRRAMGRLWTLVGITLFDTGIDDLNCGMKVFRRSLLAPLCLQCAGPGINLEVFATLARLKPKPTIKQVPVNHLPRRYGTQTGGSLRSIVRGVLELGGLTWRLSHHRHHD